MKIRPGWLKWGLNFYGPYLGAGVKVNFISKDWRRVRVSMKLRWYNRNIMRVHFGGSLYSMVDPHLMLMLMQILGPGYKVWDKSAHIDFVKPGRGKVFSDLEITDDDLSMIQVRTETGDKYLHSFDVGIMNEQGERVATVQKILYIRKKEKERRYDGVWEK